MAVMLAGARVFLALDEPYGEGERHLSLVFTEALSAGCPVAARDLPGLSYKDYIDRNGVAATDYSDLKDFVGRCLADLDFARAASDRSREIAEEKFSNGVLRPKYHALIQRATKRFKERAKAPKRPVRLSQYARLGIE